MSQFYGWTCKHCGFSVLSGTKKETNERKKQHKREGCATILLKLEADKPGRFRHLRRRVQLQEEKK